jgi:hypothetical protein
LQRISKPGFGVPQARFTATVLQHAKKALPHHGGNLVRRARWQVGVGVEGDGYGGVTQEFLNEFGVYAPTEQQGGARVLEVVETYIRQICLLQ